MSNLLQIESFDVHQLPELQGMKEKQLQIVKENPFVEITDNKTYEEAKKARTTLVSARTEIQNQDKLIASKIKKFRESVAVVSEELIAITKPHEDKQQYEVKRWEEVKELEKREKIRLEEERKGKIKSSINSIINEALEKISRLSFDIIDSLKVDFEQNLYKIDAVQFEEFELDFNEKLIQVKNAFSSKIKTLEEFEAQRLEKIRLQEEKAKLDAEDARLKKEREELEAEKVRLAKKILDRIAKEESERKSKEEEERKIREAEEAKQRAKAETERLEALKPDKQKATEYLRSICPDVDFPEISDSEISDLLKQELEKIYDQFQHSIKAIENFK